MAAKKGLGRGLDLLIPREDPAKKKAGTTPQALGNEQTDPDHPEGKPSEIILDINKIEPNRSQPRKQFDEQALDELADSIRQYGLIQPLLVRKKEDYYEIIAGERRWRASKKAGLKELPVVIREYDESDTLKVSLIENLQREDLNPIEEAQAYQVLQKDYGLKQEEIAESVSKSRAAITNTMRLLKLDERIQNLIIEDQISSGHGRALLSIEDTELQYKTALQIRDRSMSVREAERLIRSLLSETTVDTDQNEEDKKSRDMVHFFENQLKDILAAKVVIKNKKNNKGKIEIDYYSQEELERIIDLIQSIK